MSSSHQNASGFAMEPNVTPLIDVLLVLLIIFMAALPAKRRAMTAQLPQESQTQASSEVGIVLEVGAGARYQVNRTPVGANALGSHLAAIYSGRNDKRLIVKGARDARYQEVVTAIDIAKSAGVLVVGMDTRR